MTRVMASLLLLTWVAGCGAPLEPPPTAPPLADLAELLDVQTRLYPLLQEADLYKLLYQATLGPSHLFLGQDSELEQGLWAEVADLDPSPAAPEPLLETLDARRGLIRVNLRPYLQGGGTVDDLARAVARTTHEFRGDVHVFQATLARAAALLDDYSVAFNRKDLNRHVEEMAAEGLPPGVHSATYARTYAPAYRVVLRHHLTDPDFEGRFPPPPVTAPGASAAAGPRRTP